MWSFSGYNLRSRPVFERNVLSRLPNSLSKLERKRRGTLDNRNCYRTIPILLRHSLPLSAFKKLFREGHLVVDGLVFITPMRQGFFLTLRIFRVTHAAVSVWPTNGLQIGVACRKKN